MKRNTEQLRNKLLNLLSDGTVYSGEQLGQILGVTRAAVANHVQSLSELGLDIFRVRGKGYQLASSLELLSAQAIKNNMVATSCGAIEVLNVIGSTSDYLKSHLKQLENGHVCLAEAQTAGRGRHGRSWISPLGASLYLSMYWSFRDGYQALAGLSLAIGVAVVRALKAFGVEECQLKWPNDVYLNGRKLSGILIEVEGQIGAACDTIIGIGLNIKLPQDIQGIGQPWTDLYSSLGVEVSRNNLAASLISELYQALGEFEQKGLEPFIKHWQELDIYANSPVRLLMGDKVVEGVAKGINGSGALLLQINDELKAFHGGEISVRPQS